MSETPDPTKGFPLQDISKEPWREKPRAAHNADAALREACDWLERLVQHYDPDDTEGGNAEIARLRSALRSPATGEAQ